MKDENLDLFMNKKNGMLFIQNFARDTAMGLNSGWGPLIQISNEDFKTDGLNIIKENLSSFYTRNYKEGCELSKYSIKKLKNFHNNHMIVGVSLTTTKIGFFKKEKYFEITPYKQIKGEYFEGNVNNQIKLPEIVSQCEFFRSIMVAFDVIRKEEYENIV